MKKLFLILFLMTFSLGYSQPNYTWIGGATGSWTVSTNWSPTRATPAITDILNFTSTASVTAIPTQSITGLNVTGTSTIVELSAGGANTLTILSDGSATNEVYVASGCTLRNNGTVNPLVVQFVNSGNGAATTSALIDGRLELKNSNVGDVPGNPAIANRWRLYNCITTVSSTGYLLSTGTGNTNWEPMNNTGNVTAATAPANLSSTLLIINGTFEYNWSGIASGAVHLPFATWGTGSLCLISSVINPVSGTVISNGGLGQDFYNLTWNCPTQGANAANLSTSGVSNLKVLNNFTIANTGTGSIILNANPAGGKTIKNYIQTGGTLNFSNSPSASLNIIGDFSHTGGTITRTASTGTFNFNGTTTQTYTSGGTLSSVINHNIASGATVDFGTSVISSGSTGTFTLNSGAKIITSNANGLGATGTVQSTGVKTFNSGATYEFKGASTGAFTLTTANTITGGLIFSSNGTTTLNQNLTSPNISLINNSIVTTGANVLTLSSGGTYTRTADSWVNGFFNKYIAAASTSTIFEIGDASNYSPITLNYTDIVSNSSGFITASATAGEHPNISSSTISRNKNVNRYYRLTRTVAPPGLNTFNPTFTYLSGDNDAGTTPSNYNIQRYSGSWAVPTTDPTPTSTSATASNLGIGLNAYGDFIIGENKVAPTFTVTIGSYTYNKTPQGPNSISTLTPAPDNVTYSYSGNSYSGIGYAPSATPPTLGGTYSVTATIQSDDNYPTTSSASTTFIINKISFPVNAVNDTKVYDGTTSSVGIPTYNSLLLMAGDVISATPTQVFNNKNAGTGKVLLASGLVINDGDGGNNYNINNIIFGTGTITKANLTANLTNAVSKIYDGNTTATLTSANYALSGVLGLDDVSTSKTSGTYDNSNFGTAKTVTVTGLTLSGADSGNYILTNAASVSGAIGEIVKRPLTITANDQIKCAETTFTFVGTEFTRGSIIVGDSVDTVTLTSTGSNSGATANTYPIVASNATGTSITNYDITYIDGSLLVNPLPTATISGTATICINTSTLVTFTGADGTGTVRYEFTYKIGTSGTPKTITTQAGNSTVSLTVPTNFVGSTDYILISVRDVNTDCTQVQSGTATITTERCTQVRPLQCGKTLPSLKTNIQVSPISGATEYTFEVTRVSNSFVTEVVSPNYYFNPANSIVGGLVYGEAYNVRVKLKYSGVYQTFGPFCTVTAPTEPIVTTTQVRAPQCGATLSSIAVQVEANPVYQATQYEFEVTSGAGTIIVPSNNYYFSLYYSVPGRALYSTPYSIRVRSKGATTAFTAWGATCIVTTPAAPMARMADTNNLESIFNVKAFPNPFASHFSLDIESSSDAQVEMTVYDMIGRQLEVRKATVSEMSVLEVGNNYPSGIYNLILSQGKNVKSIRMIKR